MARFVGDSGLVSQTSCVAEDIPKRDIATHTYVLPRIEPGFFTVTDTHACTGSYVSVGT